MSRRINTKDTKIKKYMDKEQKEKSKKRIEINEHESSLKNSIKREEGTKDENKDDIKDCIERNKYTFETVNMWINNAESKISIAFAMFSAFIGLIVFICDSLFDKLFVSPNARGCFLYAFYVTAFLAFISFIISVGFYISTVTPRFTSDKSFLGKKYKNEIIPKYSIYYDEIKDFENANDFVECAKLAKANTFNEELLKEVYYNSRICSKKMHCFGKGILTSFITIVASLLAALFYFLYAIGV